MNDAQKVIDVLWNGLEDFDAYAAKMRHVGVTFTRWQKFRMRWWLFWRKSHKAQAIIIGNLSDRIEE